MIEVKRNVKRRLKHSVLLRQPDSAAYVSSLLSNITWNEGKTMVVSASAYMTTWILKMNENDSFIDDGGSYVDPIAEAWEDEFIKLLATNAGYKV